MKREKQARRSTRYSIGTNPKTTPSGISAYTFGFCIYVSYEYGNTIRIEISFPKN
ncbi:hypothetical protein LEP1GSC058_4052 [Leptospira fainei serovar Hurstbridge str. BUT 6]|uniref:Uncharacterized protein n=1 Tax=Leptospira fainei serovar Hurstbridge str. BUT 6 TaxID=1193011 RepID=S3UVR1_9LEPT|nr:hypothetical protein LEP1GSC058_4052 [Leptospira fainei serovar Hurstbridge str. BUT 6]